MTFMPEIFAQPPAIIPAVRVNLLLALQMMPRNRITASPMVQVFDDEKEDRDDDQ